MISCEINGAKSDLISPFEPRLIFESTYYPLLPILFDWKDRDQHTLAKKICLFDQIYNSKLS